jgi:hypothetical protein
VVPDSKDFFKSMFSKPQRTKKAEHTWQPPRHHQTSKK